MFGKKKCKILKEIRKKISEENDIPYVTSECTHKGECSGTCPRCEQELRELERQLELRSRMGKAVAVSAVAAGIAMNMSGCVEPKIDDSIDGFAQNTESVMTLEGEAVLEPLEGDVAYDPSGEEEAAEEAEPSGGSAP